MSHLPPSVSAAIRDQQKWIARCGGDLEGYRQHYGDSIDGVDENGIDIPTKVDVIYHADINRLRKLQGVPDSVIEHDDAIRRLGEEYFA